MPNGIKKNTLVDGLRKVAKNFPDVVARALMMETEIEATEARRRTPVDTGALRRSVRADGPYRSGRSIYTRIVAGDASTAYAIIVHEDPDAFHPIGQFKFVESVILESRQWLASRVARRIDFQDALNGVSVTIKPGLTNPE